MPFFAAPKSSTARRAATTEPGPVRSAYRPDMSFRTPILMMPSETWAWAVPASAATAAAINVRCNFMVPPVEKALRSYAEIRVQFWHRRLEPGIGNHVHHAPVFHDVMAVGHRLREAEVLFDQQDGEAFALQASERAPDVLHDHRREAFGRLVQQQQARPGAQDAADGEHLLLAAGELGALAGEALPHVREQLEDLRRGQTTLAHLGWQQQVLLHVQAGKDATLLGAECDA